MTRTGRTIVCGTGGVGSAALREALCRPWVEVVGVQVYSDDKAGRDAGERLGVRRLRLRVADALGVAVERIEHDQHHRGRRHPGRQPRDRDPADPGDPARPGRGPGLLGPHWTAGLGRSAVRAPAPAVA
jgi:hypothetical protein